MKKILILFVLAVGLSGTSGAYEVVPVKNGGSVAGRVLFKGTIPPAVILPINKNTAICGQEQRVIQDAGVRDGGLSQAVVYLDDIKKGRSFDAPGEGFELIQEECRFIPHLQVVKQKGNLTIYNKDSVAHNIHTFEMGKKFARTLFNQMQPNSTLKITEKVRLRRSKIMKVECDIHSFMHAWVFVSDHPYFAKVSDNGSFVINDIPPGKYSVRAWNPVLGEMEREVTVKSSGRTELNIEFIGN